MRLFTGDETCEDQHGALDAGFAEGNSLFRTGHAEPVRAEFLEGFRDLRPAVAVAVALNDAQNFTRRFALFGFWIYERADGVKIMLQRAQGDFGPNRPALKIHF